MIDNDAVLGLLFFAFLCALIALAYVTDCQREKVHELRQKMAQDGELAELAQRVLDGDRVWLLIASGHDWRSAAITKRVELSPKLAMKVFTTLVEGE